MFKDAIRINKKLNNIILYVDGRLETDHELVEKIWVWGGGATTQSMDFNLSVILRGSLNKVYNFSGEVEKTVIEADVFINALFN